MTQICDNIRRRVTRSSSCRNECPERAHNGLAVHLPTRTRITDGEKKQYHYKTLARIYFFNASSSRCLHCEPQHTQWPIDSVSTYFTSFYASSTLYCISYCVSSWKT